MLLIIYIDLNLEERRIKDKKKLTDGKINLKNIIGNL
jgi:hypothetical protein